MAIGLYYKPRIQNNLFTLWLTLVLFSRFEVPKSKSDERFWLLFSEIFLFKIRIVPKIVRRQGGIISTSRPLER